MFFFFNDTATTEIYTLSLHDALPIWAIETAPPPAVSVSSPCSASHVRRATSWVLPSCGDASVVPSRSSADSRSEEHTSELQSRQYLVCRLLLEKKTTNTYPAFLSTTN